MKKIIFALVALMVALPMVAQERVNRAKARWIGEGEKITNVMGWGYDDTAGEWVGCANVIETKVSNIKYTNSDYWKSHTYNNIISIQLKKWNTKEIPSLFWYESFGMAVTSTHVSRRIGNIGNQPSS